MAIQSVPVDGSGVTQPVSAASLPLPTGAATAAKQPALGTSGAASTDVITVQGIAGGIALPVSVTSIFGTRTDTYTVAANGVTINASTAPVKAFAIAVKGTGGAATAWNIVLEGSLDNVNFTTILTHSNLTGDGVVLYGGANLFPSLYYRSRLVSVTLGVATNLVVVIVGAN
jgi:hypothetical protein